MSTDTRETDRGGTVKERIRGALEAWTAEDRHIHHTALSAALTEIEMLEGDAMIGRLLRAAFSPSGWNRFADLICGHDFPPELELDAATEDNIRMIGSLLSDTEGD